MEIRKGIYTVYNGIEMLVEEYYGHGISDPKIENHRRISYKKELGNLDGFKLDYKTNFFFKDIHIDELKNAFTVETKGKYHNEIFSLWGYNKKRNVIGLITNNEKIARKFDFIKLSEGYIKEINPYLLDIIWEERTKSKLNLPIPKEIKKKKIIYQNELS